LKELEQALKEAEAALAGGDRPAKQRIAELRQMDSNTVLLAAGTPVLRLAGFIGRSDSRRKLRQVPAQDGVGHFLLAGMLGVNGFALGILGDAVGLEGKRLGEFFPSLPAVGRDMNLLAAQGGHPAWAELDGTELRWTGQLLPSPALVGALHDADAVHVT